MIEIGKRLIEAKEQVSHGEWEEWLETKVDFSKSTAKNFIRVAKEFPNRQAIVDLGQTKIFKLLDLPQEEREDFISQPHKVNGQTKTVDEMTTRELQKIISLFNPKEAGTIVYFNNIGEYQIDVIPEFLPAFNESSMRGINRASLFTVQLKALDPYWTDKSEIDAEIPMTREENLFEFPLEITDNFEFSRLIAGEVLS